MADRSNRKEFDPFREPSLEEKFISRRGDTDLKRFMMAISALGQESVTPEEKARYFSTLQDSINDLVPRSIVQTLARVSSAKSPEEIDLNQLNELKKIYDEHQFGERERSPVGIAMKFAKDWEIGVEDPLRRGDYELEELKSIIPLLPQNWYEILKDYEKKKITDKDKSNILEALYKNGVIEPLFTVGVTLTESITNLVQAVEKRHDLVRWPNVQKTFGYLGEIIEKNELNSDIPQETAKGLLSTQIKTVEVAGAAIDTHDREFLITDITTQFSVNWADTLNSMLANLQSQDAFGKPIELVVNMKGFSGEHAIVPGHATETFLLCRIDKDGNAKTTISLTRSGEAINPRRLAARLETVGLKMSTVQGKPQWIVG